MERGSVPNKDLSTGTCDSEETKGACESILENTSLPNLSNTPISSVLIKESYSSEPSIIEDAEMNYQSPFGSPSCSMQSEREGSRDQTRKEVVIDLKKSVRQGRLAKNLVQRPTREDLVQRGILSKSNSSSSITSKIPILERRLKEDIVKHNLQNRPGMDELVERNIQVNPQLTPVLRSKASELEMKVKKHMMEQNLFRRPTPREIRSRLPGVYNSLSEEAKHYNTPTEGSAMKKVYISFVEATLEQLLINEKISAEEYNQLCSFLKKEESEQYNNLIDAVKEFNESRDVEKYERKILSLLAK